MFFDWTWIVGLMIGATIGSFLNVVIYRLPRRMSLGNPKHSFCPSCKNRLGWIDMVPLFSWLVLRGKCRQCGAKVSSRYLFVELVNGVIWGGLWYQYLIRDDQLGRAVFYALAGSLLVVCIFIDIELYIIPDEINALLLLVGIGYNVYLFLQHSPEWLWHGVPSSLAGALVGVAALWLIAFLGRLAFGKDAMGHGDIKMARGVGALLFPVMALTSFGLAIALGAVLGVAQVLIRKQPPKSEDEDAGEPPPESIPSLLKCGLGYVCCIDALGLFYPPLYEKWFGDEPYDTIEEVEDFEVERTMIPFGPYLALGAIVAMIFQNELAMLLQRYVQYATGGR
jgi:leader peptidase (prepilin peptidase)/N-methyltransferase